MQQDWADTKKKDIVLCIVIAYEKFGNESRKKLRVTFFAACFILFLMFFFFVFFITPFVAILLLAQAIIIQFLDMSS